MSFSTASDFQHSSCFLSCSPVESLVHSLAFHLCCFKLQQKNLLQLIACVQLNHF